MTVRLIICGETRCEIFAEICLIADYLSQNLPNFCWERIEKSLLEWKAWLLKINLKNKWHHMGSPLVWKEMLHKGSKAFYIGGASEFLEYCHSYYNLDSFLCPDKLENVCNNFAQFQLRIHKEKQLLNKKKDIDKPFVQTSFAVCISGAGHPLAKFLISELLELAIGERNINRIYIHDKYCTPNFMQLIETECRYIFTDNPGKVVRYVEKIGTALSYADILIVLDHERFNEDKSIGEWLYLNRIKMLDLSILINASARRSMNIIFPNIGPACYNATILMENCNISRKNIVVATSGLGREILGVVGEIAEVPMRNIFCAPVWGFVGINHLVDIRTTVHRYNTFEPYNRYSKVKNSSLIIGSITPEFRTMEYLMYFDDTLWKKVAEMKSKISSEINNVKKVIAVVDIIKQWLFKKDPNRIVNLGVRCNGTFGLRFKGVFSQPCRLLDGEWVPAYDFPLPKDPYVSLTYLSDMAEYIMTLNNTALPKLVPYMPCCCKPKKYEKKSKDFW